MPHSVSASSCSGAKHLSVTGMTELDSLVSDAFLIDGRHYALALGSEERLMGYHILNDEKYEMSQEGVVEELEPVNSLVRAYEVILQHSIDTKEMTAVYGAETGVSFYAETEGHAPPPNNAVRAREVSGIRILQCKLAIGASNHYS